MSRKSQPQKLTDAERHKRFVEMAKEVEASEDPNDFDRAFEKVTANSTDSKGRGESSKRR